MNGTHITLSIMKHSFGSNNHFLEFSRGSTVSHNYIERRKPLLDRGTYVGFKARAFRLKNRTENEQVLYCLTRGLPKTIWSVD